MYSSNIWIIYVMICNSFMLTSSQESTDNSENVTVEIPDYIENSKDCIFPLNFELTLKFQNGSILSMLLTRNTNLHVNGPLYVIRRTPKGTTMVIQDKLQEIQDVEFYQNLETEASIALTCYKDNGLKTLEITGTYTAADLQYSLSVDEIITNPPATSKVVSKTVYRVTQKPRDLLVSHDYRHLPADLPTNILQKDFLSTTRQPADNRSRRGVGPRLYTVDLLVVVDYQIYQDWYKRDLGYDDNNKDQNVKNNLRRYFSHFVNEIDLRYKGIISADLKFAISIAGFIVTDKPDTYPWIEIRRETAKPRDYVNADDALKDFRFWVRNTKGLPPHDHAMLFTGVDLYSSNENTKLLHTAGLAFIGSMCRPNGDSVSVVEDHGGLQNIGTASHELGHSLGALHDGEDNSCTSSNRYIMASSGYGPIPPEKRLNQWKFSSCTVDYFREFINNLTRMGYSCLSDSYEDVGVESTEVPGQLFNPDEQCRLIWGPTSYLCRGYEFGNASTICTAMYCRDPATDSDCVLHFAARGTSCGNKKWCSAGECVLSPHAPENQGTCLLGDQPGIAFISKTCDELVNEVPAYCYQEKVRARCCGSCGKYYTWRKGCEYGDRVKGCQAWHCNMINTESNIESDCCGTCKVGEKITTTPTPTFTVTPQQKPEPPTIRTSCSDKADINDKSCEDFVHTNGPHLCYDSIIESFCCHSCFKLRQNEYPECLYGDRLPSLCSNSKNHSASWCETYKSDCCGICREIASGAPALQWNVGLTALFITLLVFI
ncbi:uncharacterized protein LOC132548348 [Ylistrum balloti]|uniref:uncharacterized protein LOC132548348 n=1 Tax=Ylistrum balloti TaxID=509963 RepID=UPI002905EE16|nr:uncharacterized protein LOC132548348 [Ylistrum balloti]